MSPENAILAAVVWPLAGALAIALAGRVSANLRETATMITAEFITNRLAATLLLGGAGQRFVGGLSASMRRS